MSCTEIVERTEHRLGSKGITFVTGSYLWANEHFFLENRCFVQVLFIFECRSIVSLRCDYARHTVALVEINLLRGKVLTPHLALPVKAGQAACTYPTAEYTVNTAEKANRPTPTSRSLCASASWLAKGG